jgi:hypothetical protein
MLTIHPVPPKSAKHWFQLSATRKMVMNGLQKADARVSIVACRVLEPELDSIRKYHEEEYEPRFGRETAEWIKREELKHYTHIVLINTGVADLEPLREIARENALFFNMKFMELEGQSLAYFNKLIKGRIV